MKNIIYILLLPSLILAQSNTNYSSIKSKKLIVSFEGGSIIYSGNKFLGDQAFTREGVFAAINFLTKKNITQNVSLISQSSFSISNAVKKEIHISVRELDINFVTKIPNILSCNINYSLTINKQIKHFLDHGISMKFRLYPLFYKKGQVFDTELHSLGGFISSEQNGSLPDLEKATQISYSLNYSFSDLTSISFLIFFNSDWSINNFKLDPLYPGLSIKFKKILNQNFQPPWIKRLNK